MKRIDCLGETCPLPMLLLQKEYDALCSGASIMLVTDHRCTLAAVGVYCDAQGFYCDPVEVIPGVWEITICQRQ